MNVPACKFHCNKKKKKSTEKKKEEQGSQHLALARMRLLMLGLPDLANRNMGCPPPLEFQVNGGSLLGTSVLRTRIGTHSQGILRLGLLDPCGLPESPV